MTSDDNYDPLITEFRKIAEEDPSNPRGYAVLGMLLLLAGRPQDAVAMLRPVVSMDPTNIDARVALGRAFYQSDDSENCLITLDALNAQLERVNIPEATQAQIHQLCAASHARLGNKSRAVDEVGKVDRQMLPDVNDFVDSGIAFVEKTISMGGDEAEGREIQRRLEQLRKVN